MAEFVKAASAQSVPPGTMLSVEVEGEQVLVANVDGEYLAMGAVCTHEQWDLSEGTLDGAVVTCAGHGSVWDIRTGEATFDEPLDKEPLYDAKSEGGFVWVRRR